MSTTEELLNKLSDTNNNIKYNRNFFNHKIYPFFSLEPERAKFKNDLHGVLGSLVRLSRDLEPKYEKNDSSIARDKLDLDFIPESLEDEILDGLVSSQTVESINHPFFMNYIPSSVGPDKKGEIEIANLLVEFFNLDSSNSWKEYVGNKEYTNILSPFLSFVK